MNGPEVERLTVRVSALYTRYARAVDDEDIDALRSLVTDDVAITRGAETEEGVEAFLRVYRAHFDNQIPLCQHAISNVSVGPSRRGLRSQAYFRALFFESERTRFVVGRYDDNLIDVDGALLVAHKRNVVQRVVELPAAAILG